jgi:hypothetical protein
VYYFSIGLGSAVYIDLGSGFVVTYCECTIIQLIDLLVYVYAIIVLVVVMSIMCEGLLWYCKSDCCQCERCYR